MTQDEREERCHLVARAAIDALKALGCDAAVVLADPGGDTYISARGGNNRHTIMKLIVQGSIGTMQEMAKEAGVNLTEDMPEHVKQSLERLGMAGTFGVGRDKDAGGLGHLSDYTRKTKF